MKPDHMSAEVLEAMAAGERSVADVTLRALQHLGGEESPVCPACRETLSTYPPGRINERAGGAYTETLAKAAAKVEDLAAEHRRATGLLQELAAEPDLARAVGKVMSPRFASAGLAMVLIDHATAALPETPEGAQHLARLGVVVATRIDRHRYRDWPSLPDDLECAARARLADALRANGRFEEAEEVLARAEAARQRGRGERHFWAEVELVRCRLLLAQGRAAEVRERVYEVEEWAGREGAGRDEYLWQAIRVAAQAARAVGEPLQAADELHGLAAFMRARSPWPQEHRVRLELVGALAEAGGYPEAWTQLGKVRMLSDGSESPVALAREAFWEGTVLGGLGHLEQAAGGLGRAREVFVREGRGLEALRTTLQLLEVLGQAEREDALERVAEELPDLLTADGLPPWARGHLLWTLKQFWTAAPEERGKAVAVGRLVLEELLREGLSRKPPERVQ